MTLPRTVKHTRFSIIFVPPIPSLDCRTFCPFYRPVCPAVCTAALIHHFRVYVCIKLVYLIKIHWPLHRATVAKWAVTRLLHHRTSCSILPQLLLVCQTSLYMVRICTRPRDFYRPQGIDCACMVHLSSQLSLRRMGST